MTSPCTFKTTPSDDIDLLTSRFYSTESGRLLEYRLDLEIRKKFYFVHCFVRTRKSDRKVFVQLYEFGDNSGLANFRCNRNSITITEVTDFDSLLEKLLCCAEMYILFGDCRRAAFKQGVEHVL